MTSAIKKNKKSTKTPNRNGHVSTDGVPSAGLYERQDWTLFRSVSTLTQMAGAPPEVFRKLVAKETQPI